MSVPTGSPRRSFSAALKDETELITPETVLAQMHHERVELPQRTLITGVVLVVLAVVLFVITALVPSSDLSMTPAQESEILDLQSQISVVQADLDSLPDHTKAVRGLEKARKAAEDVAKLENDFRFITSDIAAAGELGESGKATSRSLSPYFASATDAVLLDPWYLLASDATMPKGSGIPEFFNAGFEWVAFDADELASDGTVRVTWRAVELVTNDGRTPRTLAWASASYDLGSDTFSDLQVKTTKTGELLALDVSASADAKTGE